MSRSNSVKALLLNQSPTIRVPKDPKVILPIVVNSGTSFRHFLNLRNLEYY